MYPILFNLGPITIRSYGLFLVLAFILGTFIIWKEGRRSGYNEEKLLDYAVVLLVSALLGARLFYVLFNIGEFAPDPLRIFEVWQGGFVFYGALIGGILGAWYYVRKVKWPFFQIADFTVIAAALAAAIAKVGAFLAGSDYGITTTAPWGVTVIGQLGARHPAQLYEAVYYVFMFYLLKMLDRQKKKSGGVFFVYVLLLGAGRWVLEFFRGDSTFIGNFKVAQVVSILLVIVGVVGLYYFSRRDWKADLRSLVLKFDKGSQAHLSKRRKE